MNIQIILKEEVIKELIIRIKRSGNWDKVNEDFFKQYSGPTFSDVIEREISDNFLSIKLKEDGSPVVYHYNFNDIRLIKEF